MIRTIIFDLGKTLIGFEFERGYRELAKLSGHSAPEIRARIAASGLVEPFETGLLEPGQFVRELSDALGVRVGYRQFCDIWSGVFLPEPLIPESLIEALGTRYRLLLLSNTNAIHFDWLSENFPILKHFDDFVLSYRVKRLKPSPAIYRAALERAGCPPQECFYTDDIAAYVEGARREGIPSAQFQSVEQLQRDMREHGIAC